MLAKKFTLKKENAKTGIYCFGVLDFGENSLFSGCRNYDMDWFTLEATS